MKTTTYHDGLAKRDTIQLLIACFDVIHVDFRTGNHNPGQYLMTCSNTLSKTSEDYLFIITHNIAGYGFEYKALLLTHIVL